MKKYAQSVFPRTGTRAAYKKKLKPNMIQLEINQGSRLNFIHTPQERFSPRGTKLTTMQT